MGGGGWAQASGRAPGGGCPLLAAMQPGLPSTAATPPGACPLRPQPLGGGFISLNGRQHMSSPWLRASHVRLSLVGATGQSHLRRGCCAGCLSRRPPCRRSRGFRLLARCVGPTAHTVVRGSGVRVGTGARGRGSCLCRSRPRVAAALREPLARPAALTQLSRPHPLPPTFALPTKMPCCPLAFPTSVTCTPFASLVPLANRIHPPETSRVFRVAQPWPSPGPAPCPARRGRSS